MVNNLLRLPLSLFCNHIIDYKYIGFFSESNRKSVKSFFKEGIMLTDYKHERVLTPIGVCIEEKCNPMIILPLMVNGDLLSYLRNDQILLTVKQLLEIAQQIAEGIQ